jgi:hypothetical protein
MAAEKSEKNYFLPCGPTRLEFLEGTMPIINNMEGTRPLIIIMEGTPPLRGVPYPTF